MLDAAAPEFTVQQSGRIDACRMHRTGDIQAKALALIKSSASLSLGVIEHSNFGG